VDYRKFGEAYYVRVDRGEEVIASILVVCRKEGLGSVTFSGIGGCSEAEIQTFIPEEGAFESRRLSGMLELVSLNGNAISDDQGELYCHAHAAFAYKQGDEHCIAAGHVKSITVLYTAEVEVRPTIGGFIMRKHDPETGTGFWDFR